MGLREGEAMHASNEVVFLFGAFWELKVKVLSPPLVVWFRPTATYVVLIDSQQP